MKFEVGKMSVEVNWSPDVTPCKTLKFTFDGKEEIVGMSDIYSMLMLFGDDKVQDAIIPVVKTEMRRIRRKLLVRATKEMKPGDIMMTHYSYDVPEDLYQKLLKEQPERYKPADELSTPSLAPRDEQKIV